MIQANLIPHGHADLVTRELILQYLGRMQKEYTLNMADVAYDFYGERCKLSQVPSWMPCGDSVRGHWTILFGVEADDVRE